VATSGRFWVAIGRGTSMMIAISSIAVPQRDDGGAHGGQNVGGTLRAVVAPPISDVVHSIPGRVNALVTKGGRSPR